MKIFLLFILLSIILGCQTAAKEKVPKSAPISIIFDTDVGNDIDDVLALDMLYKYLDQGKINLLGIVSSKENHPYCVEFLDIMNTWYGYPNIPVGELKNGVSREDSIYKDHTKYTKYVCEQEKDGKPLFKRTKKNYDDIPYSVDLMRKLLANAPDKSVIIITVGFSTNISRLLDSEPDKYSPLKGKDLISKKVKYLSMMAGHSKKSEIMKEFNVYMDENSARNVFDNWPTPIICSGFEVGISILYPASSILDDFKYVQYHPMLEAYKAYLPMPYDRPTWDLTAVLSVVESDSSFFGHTPAGEAVVGPANFVFEERPGGKLTFLSVTPEQSERIKNRFITIITTQPKKKSYEN